MLRAHFKSLMAASLVSILAIASGCCGPIGCGPGCGIPGDACGDCDGAYVASRPIARTPLEALMNAKRSLVCGGGCGEVYYGEWTSTPPDACDPCCGDHFVGGATKCTPFCWQPGALLGGLYGGRYCDGSELVDGSCGCEGMGCDDCLGTVVEDTGCSCATCDATPIASGGQTRIARGELPLQQNRGITQKQAMAARQMQQTNQRVRSAQLRTTTNGQQMYR